MTLLLVLALAQVALESVPTPSPTPERAPLVVVERVLEVGNQTRRVSLFSNRMAVVSVREGERQVLLRRLTLDEGEYIAYLTALQRDAAQLEERRSDLSTTQKGVHGVITIAVGETPRHLEYWALDAQELSTGRLLATLDDIERRVTESSPSAEELRGWEPQVGDVVELFEGKRATVDRVLEGGLIFVRIEGSPLLEAIAPERRAQRIRRLVGKVE